MAHVTIYTRPGCGYCHRALALLEQKGADFTEIEAGFHHIQSLFQTPLVFVKLIKISAFY